MRISSRIFLGFGVLMALMVAMAALQLEGSARASEDVRVRTQQAGLLGTLHELDREVLAQQRDALIFAATGNPSMLARVRRANASVARALAQIAPLASSPEQRELCGKLETLRAEYLEAFERLSVDRNERDTLYERCRGLSEAIERRLQGLEQVRAGVPAALEAFALADRALVAYVEQPDSAAVRAVKRQLDRTVEALADADLATVVALVREYEAAFLKMVQAIRGHLFLANVVLAGQSAEIAYGTRRLRAELEVEAAAVLSGLEAAAARSAQRGLSVALVTLILGTVVSMAVSRSISEPIAALTRTFSRLAAGEQVDSVPGRQRGDEIGAMAGAAEVFAEKNRETKRLLEVTREHETALREQARELERANEELEQFAYVASHDLQEPLRMVASYVQLLQLDYGDRLGEEADEYIGFAAEGARRMQVLINDLLELTRLGRTGREPEPVDTGALLEAVRRELQPQLTEGRVELSAAALPTLRAFPGTLRQVFQNFLTNAIKYRCPEGPARVHVRAVESGDGWVFHFEDNGIGIDPAHGERIFRIFQRLHGRREYEGSGMGLAIVKKIAEQHGGRVWVESNVGQGSDFCFLVGKVAA